ncbi:MAG: hypothetical protein KGJ66_10650 [Alphaproteobacteria bacterium]|nr:hypothetical protein [Alphaproteobacteria bacterium]
MLAVILLFLGLGAACVALYQFAVFALPAYVGFAAGFWAIHTGAGTIGGILVGIVAGALVFVVGQLVFASSRSPILRILVALLFAVPATYAGYSIVQQVWALTMPPTVWRYVFGVTAAMMTGGTALARLSAPLQSVAAQHESIGGRTANKAPGRFAA